jgi:signal peptidase II
MHGIGGYFLCTLAVFIIDQATKKAIVSTMVLHGSTPLIPGFFHLTYIMNYGASFGMLQDKTFLFIGLTIAVVIAMCWAVFFLKRMTAAARLLFGIITGGALGNLADRLQYGAVVDFLDFQGIWKYIFNVADAAVICGGAMLACLILLDGRMAGRRKPQH